MVVNTEVHFSMQKNCQNRQISRQLIIRKFLTFPRCHTIIYMGGLYAGGVLGLAKTFRGFSLRDGQKIIFITIGLSDPDEPENRHNIRMSIQKQLPSGLFQQAKIFHLRGGIDYQKLSFGHRTMMALLYRSLRKTPLEQQTPEDRALIETYGKQVDFINFSALESIIQEIQRK